MLYSLGIRAKAYSKGQTMATKKRLDQLLVDRGLIETRTKAQGVILAGKVRVAGQVVCKAGHAVPVEAPITLAEPPRFVGRGGLKLEAALTTFGVEVQATVALDVGASTGGFTDCLLRYGAKRVYAVDVGYGQLHHTLRIDPRVIVLERVNVRTAPLELIPEPVDLAVMDVSFISATLLFAPVLRWLRAGGRLVVLVKPQFEAGRKEVGKGGIVRDPRVHEDAIEKIRRSLLDLGCTIEGVCPSPISGADGNLEFLLTALYSSPTHCRIYPVLG